MASGKTNDHTARFILHDLASPLSSIKLNLELLAEQSDLRNRKLKNIINNMNFGIDTLTEIINWKLEKETKFSLKETVEEVYKLVENECRREKIAFRSSIAGAGDYKIAGYKIQFVRILTNLFSNSIDALKNSDRAKKSREISFRAYRSGNFLMISIEDNGGGMLDSVMIKAGVNNFTTKENGHGLGLFGCRLSLAKYFSGKISIESDCSKRTTKILIGIPASRFGDAGE